jgi:hypothetical protein
MFLSANEWKAFSGQYDLKARKKKEVSIEVFEE